MIPGSILTLGAGFVYVQMYGQMEGVAIAGSIVWISASLGAILAFINGRYLLRNVVLYYASRSATFALIDDVVGMNGFKTTVLLRLSPITPYNVFNYLMGATSVKLSDYSLGCIGMIPDSFVYCFIGGSIASFAKLSSIGFTSDPVLLIVTVVGTIISIIGILYISYLAKKEFNKMATASRLRLNEKTKNNEYLKSTEKTKMLNHSMDIVPVDINEDDLEEDHTYCCNDSLPTYSVTDLRHNKVSV